MPNKEALVAYARRLYRGFFLAFFPLILLATAAWAEGKAFSITQVQFSQKIRSGNETIASGLSSLATLSGSTQRWGLVSVQYDSKKDWADDVTLRYYVLARGSNKQPALLSGGVTYMSVAKGSGHLGMVFIHPNTMMRYGKVRRILVQLWHAGVLVDSKQWPNKGTPGWWTRIPAVEGVLRTRFFTPFEHDFEVREEDIKLTFQS